MSRKVFEEWECCLEASTHFLTKRRCRKSKSAFFVATRLQPARLSASTMAVTGLLEVMIVDGFLPKRHVEFVARSLFPPHIRVVAGGALLRLRSLGIKP
jgi:hypothetical protein